MSIDERLEFLLRSTEALYASVLELRARAAEHKFHLEIDRQDIRSLTKSRLDNLEGR
jgi:hypothetical protein